MRIPAGLAKKVVDVRKETFETIALEVFRYQAEENDLYKEYIRHLHIVPKSVQDIDAIPYLPISFFKNNVVKTGDWEGELVFSSSGTSGMNISRHACYSEAAYLSNCRRGFTDIYGKDPGEFCWFALLPSYLERSGSSLIAMASDFIGRSAYKESGFFLDDTAALIEEIRRCQQDRVPLVLLGVSYALWDLALQFPSDLSLDGQIVMETGGMKGRKEEIIREDLHRILQKAFGVKYIHSEYGMTELSSQAYSMGGGRFLPSSTMQVRAREVNDPLTLQQYGKTGVLNVIDLANVHTCSFIATDDLCKVYPDGSFELLGRLDNSDIRGCNLMVADY